MGDPRDAAEGFARHLKAKHGDRIDRIILFGSVARGVDRPGSDLDVLVVTPGDWFTLQVEVTEDAVEWLMRFGIYISAKVFSVEDFARLAGTGLGRAVAAEGIAVG